MATSLKGTIWGGGVTFSATPATISIPTGQKIVTVIHETSFSFTVPENIYILLFSNSSIGDTYVAVKPLTTHIYEFGDSSFGVCRFSCRTHSLGFGRCKTRTPLTISWSPEINKQTPTVTDY